MVISVRVSDEDGNRMKAYATYKGVTLSALLRSAVQERLENEYQLSDKEMEVVMEQTVYKPRKRKAKKKK